MKKMLSFSALTAIALCAPLSAQTPAAGINLFDDVKFDGQVRLRYENADIADNDKDAGSAFTARTRLGVTAGSVAGTSMLGFGLEGVSVNNFGYDDYFSTANGKTEYDTIVDPDQARLTQGYLALKLPAKTTIKAGRQIVNLDNQRFVGSVDWRQMPQSFDAVALVSNPMEPLNVVAAYVFGINPVKKYAVADRATETSSALINLSYKVVPEATLSAYSYMLGSISDTYGAALHGKAKVSPELSLSYRAEYAVQTDPSLEYRVEDVKADASYMNLELAATYSGATLGAGYEVLGEAGDDVANGFMTPLATLHKFNGWADVFLGSNNANGLIDMNVMAGYNAAKLGNLQLVYHSFSAQSGEEDLGSEIDVSYANKISAVNGLSLLLKAAFFSAGDESIAFVAKDKTVGWAQLNYQF